MNCIIFEYFKGLIVLIIMILMHETGHYLILRKHTKFIKFQIKPKFGLAYNCQLNTEQEKQMISSGIILGLMPIIFLNNSHFVVVLTILLSYTYGCIPDIIKIQKLNKK